MLFKSKWVYNICCCMQKIDVLQYTCRINGFFQGLFVLDAPFQKVTWFIIMVNSLFILKLTFHLLCNKCVCILCSVLSRSQLLKNFLILFQANDFFTTGQPPTVCENIHSSYLISSNILTKHFRTLLILLFYMYISTNF